MDANTTQTPTTGLAIIHGNRLEVLRALLVEWMKRHPLGVLENDTILVQSNGIAQWLRLALANSPNHPTDPGCGIAAALDIQLPSAFAWQAYRAVLGEAAVPLSSPYDKTLLTWRLMRLLPTLVDRPEFSQLRRFLSDDTSARKHYQLAERLADLLDQYQVYRADWLDAWRLGDDCLIKADGQRVAIPESQRWQCALWRAVREDLPGEEQDLSRADLHHRFLRACDEFTAPPPGLPRRVIIFGISALPRQIIEALAALAKHTQVLLCVHNPCRHYWADIIDGKERLKAARRRQRRKATMPEDIAEEDLHLHAQPLLAAWGKQGRDYLRLLDQFDDTEHYQDWFERIDLFDEPEEDPDNLPLLRQLQEDILDLRPLPDNRRTWKTGDRSVYFQLAHSRQREVEILHDHLLSRFEADPTLRPRDIIVMVPDVNQYAPHIRAVFGHLDRGDDRYIPFTLSDQQRRGQNPLLVALELLLGVTRQRFTVSQLFDLLEVPAVRERFGLAEADLPTLQRWVVGSGIRWGLDGDQRADLELPAGLSQNTWLFGLQRMLLGYAMGGDCHYSDIEAYGEVGGLDAQLVGPLAELTIRLQHLRERFGQPHSPGGWQQILSGLLDEFFAATDDRDLLLLEHLDTRLQAWREACDLARLDSLLPLEVVHEAWLAGIDDNNLSQRFLAGAVNVSTLMPMRAIPFRVICLLGMNDGDYPRVHPATDFDLMASDYRPGDRSRREDDRYLFLEALLSSRDALYISWVGKSVRDNTDQPPSVLVAQLRDHLQQGWVGENGEDVLPALTCQHPLQPFSSRYFHPSRDPRLFTYAREWREVHNSAGEMESKKAVLGDVFLPEDISLKALQGFLRYPTRTFFNSRLNVWFESPDEALPDHEPFGFDRLDQFSLGTELIAAALDSDDNQRGIDSQIAAWRRSGQLPMGAFASRALREIISPVTATLERAEPLLAQWQKTDTALEIQLPLRASLNGATLERTLEDWVGGLSSDGNGNFAMILTSPQAVSDRGRPRWHRLIAPWINHLAVSAMGQPVTTYLIGPDATATLPPLDRDLATGHLGILFQCYGEALQAPAPAACKTGLQWVAAGPDTDPDDAGEATFSGNSRMPGEWAQDLYLQRAWPDFASLCDAGLSIWSQRLYQPLVQCAAIAGGEGDQ